MTKSLKENSKPQLAKNAMQKMQQMALSPEAAFLLSRLDGNTDVKTISFMSGVPTPRVLELLNPLLKQGLITVEETAEENLPEAPVAKKVGSILDLLEHEDQDPRYSKMSKEFRNEVLLKFSGLGEISYYELLGLGKKFPPEQLKDNYFAQSKKFHPDNYFNKDIGHYRKKITRIFEKVNNAYTTIANEKLRKEYDQSLRLAAGEKVDDPAEKNPQIENMNRARRYFEWGEEDYHRGNYVSAASNFLLALTFDKENEEYKKAYARVKPVVERKRSKDLVQKAITRMESSQFSEAWQAFTEALESHLALQQDADFIMKMARCGALAEVDANQVHGYNKKAEALVGKTSYVLFTEAIILEKQHSWKAALNIYKQIQTLEPENADVGVAMKRVKEKAGK
jgi:curved DNA-binding protein CbpA